MKNKYDVIIVGAGIGGLVCASYLAKSGIKVLIVEKNNKAGGYCGSFRAGEFIFNMSTLQGCSKEAEFGKIIRELKINKKVEIHRSEPYYIILTPDYKISVGCDINKTVDYLCSKFANQSKEIVDFFSFLKNSDFIHLYLNWRDKYFKDLLDLYFKDSKLKLIFMTMLGQSTIPPSETPALTAIIYFRNLFFDGGYYVKGGNQVFIDAFVNLITDHGGCLALSSLVQKIKLKNKKEVAGVLLSNSDYVVSKYIVANCDVYHTFFDLIGREHLDTKFVNKLDNLIPSISGFMVSLGIDRSLKKEIDYCQELWYCQDYHDNPWDTNRLEKNKFSGNFYCFFHSFQDSNLAPFDGESISMSTYCPYFNSSYWAKNKNIIADKLIAQASNIVPRLDRSIVKKFILTPANLYKYTLNKNGALRGWAPFLSQIHRNTMPQVTPFNNLFLASHWVTLPFAEAGLPMAAYAGKIAAKLILRKSKNK